MPLRNFLDRLYAYAARERMPGSHAEKWLAGLGSLIAIASLQLLSTHPLFSDIDAPMLLASMGASAVLLFALPHSPLSQPWALFGGHMVSAAIGVLCVRWLPEAITAPVAVGLSITCMYYLRCLHPPGGATALAAVIASEQVQALGFVFLLTPVLLDVTCLFGIAVGFNYLFRWRRYPLAFALAGARESTATTEIQKIGIRRDDLDHALKHMGMYVDVTEHDLEQIYAMALQHSRRTEVKPEQIVLGRYYSNGQHGADWSIRCVIDESGMTAPGRDKIIYRTVAGKDRRSAGTTTRVDFALWACYEVEFKNNAWLRIERI